MTAEESPDCGYCLRYTLCGCKGCKRPILRNLAVVSRRFSKLYDPRVSKSLRAVCTSGSLNTDLIAQKFFQFRLSLQFNCATLTFVRCEEDQENRGSILAITLDDFDCAFVAMFFQTSQSFDNIVIWSKQRYSAHRNFLPKGGFVQRVRHFQIRVAHP